MAEMLERILESSGKLNFRGTEIHILIGKDGVPVVEKFAIGRKGAAFTRTERESGAQPSEIYIKNQHGSWIYYPKQNKLIRKEHTLGLERRFTVEEENRLRQVQANYEIKYIKENNIAGRTCSVYSFRPKEKGRLIREFWFDTISGLPLRIDTFAPDGRLLNVVSFETIEFNPEFPQNYFKPDFFSQVNKEQHHAMKVLLAPRRKIEEILGDGFRFPGYIPKGYCLRNVFVLKKNREKRYQIIYSDGIVPLSIFYEKMKGDFKINGIKGFEKVPLRYVGDGYFSKQQGIIKTLSFKVGDARNTIVGEIEKNEMIKIAESFYRNLGGTVK